MTATPTVRSATVAPSIVATVLAHQGGWDEILLVAAPVAVIAALLGLAKRRVDRANRLAREAAEPARSDEPHHR